MYVCLEASKECKTNDYLPSFQDINISILEEEGMMTKRQGTHYFLKHNRETVMTARQPRNVRPWLITTAGRQIIAQKQQYDD